MEVEYIIIAVNFVYKWAQQLFSGHYKIIVLYFQNIFPVGAEVSLWPHGCTIFQSRILKLLSNSKPENTSENKKRRQSVPVLNYYLEKQDIKL